MAYAQGTSVSAERSSSEIEKILQRFGASQFARMWDTDPPRQSIQFRLDGRIVRLDLPLPEKDDPEFTHTAAGKQRTQTQSQEHYEAEVRRRWRALVLVVKAKLTAVADGISTLEREFFADLVMPNGRTLLQSVAPQLEAAFAGNGTLALMPGDAK